MVKLFLLLIKKPGKKHNQTYLYKFRWLNLTNARQLQPSSSIIYILTEKQHGKQSQHTANINQRGHGDNPVIIPQGKNNGNHKPYSNPHDLFVDLSAVLSCGAVNDQHTKYIQSQNV